jgi:hypothetical protein
LANLAQISIFSVPSGPLRDDGTAESGQIVLAQTRALEKETEMTNVHPIHTLRANLEEARLKAVEALAAKGGTVSANSFQELVTIQVALTAVREEIAAHGASLGWGAGSELD